MLSTKIVVLTSILIITGTGFGSWFGYHYYRQQQQSLKLNKTRSIDINDNEGFYYVFSINWPFTACVNDTKTCIKAIPNRWTIHGLWPNSFNNKMISFCTKEKFDFNQIRLLKSKLEEYWISVKKTGNNGFWKHEWEKHGTCAKGLTQIEYFRQALQLFEKYNINEIFKKNGIKYGGLVELSKIRNALESSGFQPDAYALRCKNSDNKTYLFEVRMCLSANLQQMKCRFSTNCKKPQVYYVMK